MGIIIRKFSLEVRQVKIQKKEEEVTHFTVNCGQAPSLWLKQETELFPIYGHPQLQYALLGYLQINLPLRIIQAGLLGEVLQLGFPQWVSPGSCCGVAGRKGPWRGLVGGDLVGAVCPPSLGEV